MAKITLFGGVDRIGGNKILLEDRGTRVFFDFGEPFHMKDDYFVDFLTPREGRFGLRDYFHFGLMPRIEGLYGEEWVEDTDLKYRSPEFHAVFVSHMHFDHAMHLKYVDEEIPVHLGATADTIRQSWEKTSLGRSTCGKHEVRTFRTGDKVRVDGLEVEPIHVDHSTPGAYGFIIHTSEGCVVYTGDFRLHGPRSDMTREFVQRASEERPAAMLCEGTRVTTQDPRKNMSEEGVRNEARRLISASDKLAVVSFYPKDVDRMRSFRDVARSVKRKFVVSAKVAHLLGMLQDDPNIDAPDPLKDPNMLVYVRRMAKPDRVKYEKEYLDMMSSCDRVVDSDYVRDHQRELMFHTDFSQLTELIDIKPAPGSLFIRSKSEPFEEDDVQEDVLQNWVNWFRLDFKNAHASGHASMKEVFGAVRRVAPRKVIPVHTEHPELFGRSGVRVKRPKLGVPIQVR
jgi:ribonuclease J